MPWDQELCATFYVAHPAVPGPEDRLLAQLHLIGVTDVHVERVIAEFSRGLDPAGEEVTGRWADLEVAVRDRALDLFRAVSLVFPASAAEPFSPAGGHFGFRGRGTEAFRSACERLTPVAAVVSDLAGPHSDAIVAEREQWLVHANPVPLLHEGFALLHLNRRWFRDLDRILEGLPYRRIPLPSGPLLVGF